MQLDILSKGQGSLELTYGTVHDPIIFGAF